MSAPKISVLMPIYNTEENFLREAIESVLAQTYQNFEFLILNDSPENAKLDEIVSSYSDERVKYYKNAENMGISASRNRLLEMAQGEFIAVFDHDDISLPQRFERQIAYLEKHPNVGVCGSAFRWVKSDKIKTNPQESLDIKEALLCGCCIHHPSTMIRKSVLIENNIHYEKEFYPAEDYALWCRLIDKTEFYNLPDILVEYRKHQNQTSTKEEKRMREVTILVHNFVRKENSKLWADVCNHYPCIVRVKLFGVIPLLKFKQTGLKYEGFLRHIPFLTVKTKLMRKK